MEKQEKYKYYTPNIEDIFFGYECESKTTTIYEMGSENERTVITWYSTKLGGQVKDHKGNLHNVMPHMEIANIRTPYLTKDLIQAEGWIFVKDLFKSWLFRYNDCLIQYLYEKHGMYVTQFPDYGGEGDVIFRGKCPSVNEFRKILKLLDV